MMMGMCLNYSLLKAQEVLNIMKSQEKQKELRQPSKSVVSLPKPMLTPHAIALQTIEPQALDPKNNNAINLETALVPLNTAEKPPEDDIYFDLAQIMKDFEDQNDNEDALIMAVTQIEKQFTTNTTIFKRNSPL